MSPKLKAPHTWRSGHCGISRHDACRGAYGGADCSCWCHRSTEPAAPTLGPSGGISAASEVVGVPPGLPSLLADGSTRCPLCGSPWTPLTAAGGTGGASAKW